MRKKVIVNIIELNNTRRVHQAKESELIYFLMKYSKYDNHNNAKAEGRRQNYAKAIKYGFIID